MKTRASNAARLSIAALLMVFSLFVAGCKPSSGGANAAQELSLVSTSVYLNESECSLVEKIASASMPETHMVMLSIPLVVLLRRIDELDAEIIRLFSQQMDGGLSQKDQQRLSNLSDEKHLLVRILSNQAQQTGEIILNGCVSEDSKNNSVTNN